MLHDWNSLHPLVKTITTQSSKKPSSLLGPSWVFRTHQTRKPIRPTYYPDQPTADQHPTYQPTNLPPGFLVLKRCCCSRAGGKELHLNPARLARGPASKGVMDHGRTVVGSWLNTGWLLVGWLENDISPIIWPSRRFQGCANLMCLNFLIFSCKFFGPRHHFQGCLVVNPHF